MNDENQQPCVGLKPNAVIIDVQLGEVVVLVVVVQNLLDFEKTLEDGPPTNPADKCGISDSS